MLIDPDANSLIFADSPPVPVKILNMHSRNQNPISGQLLLADYRSAFVSASTILAADTAANQSEDSLLDYLGAMTNGSYLNPSAISASVGDEVARASLDAHIKKVQAQQLHAMNAEQLQNLLEQDRSNYEGRKVRVTVLPGTARPIDAVWFDRQKGFRASEYNKSVVHGIVEEIALDKNILVLKPTWGARIITSNLQNYIVYVINPETLQPMVDLLIT